MSVTRGPIKYNGALSHKCFIARTLISISSIGTCPGTSTNVWTSALRAFLTNSPRVMNSMNFGLSVASCRHPGRMPCLLYTSDAADEEDSVDLGGRRIIKKK